MERALMRALKKAGSPAALAKINDVTPQRVNWWIKHGKKMPAQFVLKTEAATGVSRYNLRPDVFKEA